MRRDLEDELFETFPTLYQRGKSPMDQFFWGFEFDDGWFNLVKNLSYQLQKVSNQSKVDFRVVQAKEKYGQLRIYIEPHIDAAGDLLDIAEDMSASICEECGQKGTLRRGGWMFTACDECTKKRRHKWLKR